MQQLQISISSIFGNRAATFTAAETPPHALLLTIPPLQMSDSPSEQYTALLLGQRYGYPLWDPQPTEENLEYKRKGVRIGDVGSLEQGSFNYLFNICVERDAEINYLLRKPRIHNYPFVPVGIDEDEVRRKRVALPPGHCVSTKTIQKKGFNVSEELNAGVAPVTQQIIVQISCSSDKGAALLLPKGASSQDLNPLARFRDHALAYGSSWFIFLEKWGFAGKRIYLITGCHKSSGWGITFSAARSGQGNIDMVLGSSLIGGKLGYSWENSTNSENSHAGPLREPAEEDWGENQCVFIRGYIIVKRDRLASLLRTPIEVKAIGGYPDIKSSLARDRLGTSSKTSGESNTSKTSDSSGSTHGGGGHSKSELSDSTISVERIPGSSAPSHPSNAIIDYVFAKAPNATLAIVHDDEWMSVLEPEEVDKLPSDQEIVDRVSRKYHVQMQDMAVFLVEREPQMPGAFSNVVGASKWSNIAPAIMPFTDLDPDTVSERTRTGAFKLSDIAGYLDVLKHFNSIDDRKLLENLVTLMSRLSNFSAFASLGKDLQDALIGLLYKDLPHPPSTYLSLLPQSSPAATEPNPIKYAYRNADGSNYVPLSPIGLGKANTPYARSVPATNFTPTATLPDAGLVFDTLMSRDKFVPHPGGISSLFFAFADLIIYSVFNTNHVDPNINLTSSYLDLSILYGNSQKEQDSVRNKDGRGRLYEDVFADSRLLFMPPSVGALLVLLSRNHNYTAQKILEINENRTYKKDFQSNAEKTVQDDEIFNRARLVNCGYFMQIILGDYVGAILGLVRDGYSWRLDPSSQSRESTHDLTPRGEGNVVSIEFNLLYRWHATLSRQDTEWTENLFKELFEGQDFSTITIKDFMNVAHRKMIPDPDPRKWTFDKLKRNPDGRFKDSDLARILHNATSWRAGAYKARGVPEVLRVVEVLSIEQARRWGTCSMNDFRRFLGLKRMLFAMISSITLLTACTAYASFQEWNPDKDIHTAAVALYKDIDNLELYVGLQVEEPKKPMAGAGLCPGYTISRSILADVGDRFLTVEFTPFNLTTWGYHDCQFDAQDGSYGGMLTKLLFRTLPAYYPPRSAYAHFPFLDPAYMKDYMSPELAKKYIWWRPTPPEHAEEVVVVKTLAGVRKVLNNANAFPTDYEKRLEAVTGHKGVNHAFVNELLLKEADEWGSYFGTETQRLIDQRSLGHIGKSGHVQYVDIVRDVINVLPVHWICQRLAGLPLKDGDLKDEQRQCEAFADVCRYVFLNSEPSNDWRLRESSVKTFQDFDKVVKEHLGSYIRIADANRDSLADSLPFLNKLYKAHPDLKDLAVALFIEVVPTAAHWTQAIAHVVNYYLDDTRVQARQEIVRLAGLQTEENKKKLAAHVRAVLAQNPPVWGVYRTVHTADLIVDEARIPVGTRVFASIKEANVNAGAGAENPILGIGEHGFFSAKFFESTTPHVLGKILGLKNLKRAPGTFGSFNKFEETVHGIHGAAPQQWYVNSRSDLVPWPESLVVEYHV
ncbi:hypothetical protein MVEN_00196300 [Mycena venus]|uniref:Heme peroxidase n=1 Tax=Mycena venus TaxID=2733690 RepID=A0A8H6Z1K8_9AGAR|nr:hypothetical protein MVEN_00196300 [Mycena venus]